MTNPGGEVRVRMATDMTEPVSIHWGLSKVNNREWQVMLTAHFFKPPRTMFSSELHSVLFS